MLAQQRAALPVHRGALRVSAVARPSSSPTNIRPPRSATTAQVATMTPTAVSDGFVRKPVRRSGRGSALTCGTGRHPKPRPAHCVPGFAPCPNGDQLAMWLLAAAKGR
jgi:hypothetical protein